MRNRHEVEWASTAAAASGIDVDEKCSCEDGDHGRGGCGCTRNGADVVVKRDVGIDEERQFISRTPSLAVTIQDFSSTSSRSRTRTASTSSLKSFSSSSSSISKTISPSANAPITRRGIASTPQSYATTILTVIIPPTHALSPASTTSFSSSSTHTFHPTGIQSVVPTYPPFSSSSTSTTNWSSIGTKLGLGLGIPILVLLTLLVTTLLYRRQARLAKHHNHHHRRRRRHHQNPPPALPTHGPEMASTYTTTTSDLVYPRLHPVPSSRFSEAGDLIVTPAPAISPTTTAPAHHHHHHHHHQQQQQQQQLLTFPPPSSPPPPTVPRRSSARHRQAPLAGPLDSHPPVARPTSSIYEGGQQHHGRTSALRDSSYSGAFAGGGNGVGDVLAEYLEFDPQHLDGPWDPGQTRVPAVPLPPQPVASKHRPPGQRGQYLSVDVDHSPGGIDEVSPLSSSGSGPYIPNRISAMSGLKPSSPVRTHSRRRT